MRPPIQVDVVIVGGGPAGLSAALLLARSHRRIAVIDAAQPRNAAVRGVHGFLTRDGTPPAELRRLARRELKRYPGVALMNGTVEDVRRVGDGFVARTVAKRVVRARAALLAVGVADELPPIPGLAAAWGRGVYHCAYCDAWEHRHGTLVALGAAADGMALKLSRWSRRVVWCSDGARGRGPRDRQLAARGVRVVPGRIEGIARAGAGVRIDVAGARPIAAAAAFLSPPARPCPPYIAALGCRVDRQQMVRCDRHGATGVPGLYVAGDASGGAQMAIAAAADGALAAMAIDDDLHRAEIAAIGGAER